MLIEMYIITGVLCVLACILLWWDNHKWLYPWRLKPHCFWLSTQCSYLFVEESNKYSVTQLPVIALGLGMEPFEVDIQWHFLHNSLKVADVKSMS